MRIPPKNCKSDFKSSALGASGRSSGSRLKPSVWRPRHIIAIILDHRALSYIIGNYGNNNFFQMQILKSVYHNLFNQQKYLKRYFHISISALSRKL